MTGDGGGISRGAGAGEGTAGDQRGEGGSISTTLKGFAPEPSYCNPVQSVVKETFLVQSPKAAARPCEV